MEGWKERGRVWGEQAEVLDREILELRGEREKMIADNKALAEGMGRARAEAERWEGEREETRKKLAKVKKKLRKVKIKTVSLP